MATVLAGLIGSFVGSVLGHRVLGMGGFSVLLEIGIAAAAVALYTARFGRVGPWAPQSRFRRLLNHRS
ncbi:MAG: hypothetical protein ACRDRO_23120 [Pseudonocardiaceae bacterium]